MPKSFYCLSLATLGLLHCSQNIPAGPVVVSTMNKAIEFSLDGKYALVMSDVVRDPTIGLVDVEKRKWASVRFDVGHACRIATATFSPDGKMVVTGATERMPTVTTIPSPTFTPGGLTPSKTNESRRECSAICFYDMATGKQIRLLKTNSTRVNCLSFSDDGKYLLSGESDGLFLWDVAEGKPIRKLTNQRVYSAALSRDGNLALSDDEEDDYTAVLWDTGTGRRIRQFWASKGFKRLKGRDIGTHQLAFSPGESRVSYVEGSMWVWDIKSGDLVRAIRPRFSCESASFTPTGRFVLTTGMSQPCQLWEIATGKEVLTLKKKSGPNPSVAVSPDGKHVLYADEWEVSLWDLHNGSIISVIWARSGKQ